MQYKHFFSSRLLSKDFKTKIYETRILSVVPYGSYIKGALHAKGIWEQDSEVNTGAQKGWRNDTLCKYTVSTVVSAHEKPSTRPTRNAYVFCAVNSAVFIMLWRE